MQNKQGIVEEDDDLLTTPEAADFLDVAPGTLEVWRSTKRYSLEYVKIGRRNVRYKRKVLRVFRDSGTVAE